MIVIPVTSQAVLRDTVHPGVVPRTVLFANVAPFVAVNAAASLRHDEEDLRTLCPVPSRHSAATAMKTGLKSLQEAAAAVDMTVGRPMEPTMADEIASALVTLFAGHVTDLQSDAERAADPTQTSFRKKITQSLRRSQWAEKEASFTEADYIREHVWNAEIALALTKRSRDDADSRTLSLAVTDIDNRRTSNSGIAVATDGRQRAYVTVNEDDMELSHRDVAKCFDMLESTCLGSLLSPVGAAALFLAIARTMGSSNAKYTFDQFGFDLFEVNGFLQPTAVA